MNIVKQEQNNITKKVDNLNGVMYSSKRLHGKTRCHVAGQPALAGYPTYMYHVTTDDPEKMEII